MDPDANYREQVALAELIDRGDGDEDDAQRLAELVLALNRWVRNGGFPPAAFSKK